MDKITYEEAKDVVKDILAYLERETDYCLWDRHIKNELELALPAIVFVKLR